MLLSLPFIYMISAYGLVYLIDFLKNKKIRVILCLIAVFVFLIQAIPNIRFDKYDDGLKDMQEYIKNNELKEPVWISNPGIVVHSDYGAELMYYPMFDSGLIDEFRPKILKAGTIFLTTCDLVCHPPFTECEAKKREMINDLKSEFRMDYYKKQGECENYIFIGN